MTGPAGKVGTPPDHYKTDSGIQPFDVIDEYELGFYLGNAFKYVVRAEDKGDYKGDLEKARHYLEETRLRTPGEDPVWEWEHVDPAFIPPEYLPHEVISAFGLHGFLAGAVYAMLHAACAADPGFDLMVAIEELTDAINEASGVKLRLVDPAISDWEVASAFEEGAKD